jgi:hypothetical protein
MFSEFALGTKAGGIDLAKAVPLPVDENQQGPGDLVRLEYGTGPCCARRAAALCADGAPARLPLIFRFSNIVRQARALGQPVLFQPPAHTSSFSAAKQKAPKKGTSTLFRCQLQASTLEPNRLALPSNILQMIPEKGTAHENCHHERSEGSAFRPATDH